MIDIQAVLRILLALTPLLYGVAWLIYTLVFVTDGPRLRRLARPLLLTAGAVHLAYLVGFTGHFEHVPLVSVHQLVGAVAFAVAAAYLWVESRTRSLHTGPFAVLIVFGFSVVSTLAPRLDRSVPEILQSKLFGVHVSAAVLGYSAFALAAVYGLLYLMQYYGMRAKRFGLVFRRLPSLGVLDRMILYAASLGFVFLTVALVTGTAWSVRLFGGLILDPKIVIAAVTWVVYGLALVGKRLTFWTERQMAYSTLFGFAIVLFSMFVVNAYLSRFHVFGG